MITLPAILESIRSLKDRSYKLTFETGEISPAQLSEIGLHIQNAGFLAFNKEAFTHEEIQRIKSVKADYDDPVKSKAQRLRAVLYVSWEQNNLGYDVFDDYYNHKMEKIIIHLKKQLQ